ncbi:MAG: fasciclin domain-containing protein [Phormidesmis sp. CAN_BIN36]|nr:fasciclin domain-containing protein [Phormidesmis sp. CAN_BIN36]
MPDIVDTAMSAGTFTTLVAAVTAAGLDTALKSPGPFTVFAPSDDAFSKLPSGTVESLLEDLSTLRKILEYHVVSGKVMAADVVKLSKATTTQGEDVKISASSGSVKINDATVITPDIEADNGVIHVIDSVLLPASISL